MQSFHAWDHWVTYSCDVYVMWGPEVGMMKKKQVNIVGSVCFRLVVAQSWSMRANDGNNKAAVIASCDNAI